MGVPRVLWFEKASIASIAAATTLCLSAAQVWAGGDTVAQFYRNKQITLIISSSAGGGYDTLGRLLGRHLGQFIPGHPTIVAENMPGGGGILAVNDVYATAKPDGTTIGLVERGTMIGQLTQQPGVRYDVSKINWIGSLASEVSVAVSWHTSSVKTLDDLRHHELVVAGTGATSDTEASARLLNALVGTKFKIINGYPGVNDAVLAMQRGEVQGLADWSWSQLMTKDNHFLKNHEINILVQNALHKAPELPNVPLAMDQITNKHDRAVARLFFTMKEVARPVLMGPGVPQDRVDAVRKAFMAMTKDPAFLADAKKSRIFIDPSDAKAVQSFINMVETAPPDVAGRLRTILNPVNKS